MVYNLTRVNLTEENGRMMKLGKIQQGIYAMAVVTAANGNQRGFRVNPNTQCEVLVGKEGTARGELSFGSPIKGEARHHDEILFEETDGVVIRWMSAAKAQKERNKLNNKKKAADAAERKASKRRWRTAVTPL